MMRHAPQHGLRKACERLNTLFGQKWSKKRRRVAATSMMLKTERDDPRADDHQ